MLAKLVLQRYFNIRGHLGVLGCAYDEIHKQHSFAFE